MPRIDLPASVQDVLDENAAFEPAALAAVREFARSKPWQGSDDVRLAKFNAVGQKLAAAYGFEPWTIALGDHDAISRSERTVTVRKLSVVTWLNAQALIRGCTPFAAFRWSINIFRRCFPRSFAACSQQGPYLIREND